MKRVAFARPAGRQWSTPAACHRAAFAKIRVPDDVFSQLGVMPLSSTDSSDTRSGLAL
jgi:hypothetical protein